MSDTPRVSAIIVNWNGAHHLRICLPSLLAQTFKSLEIIVVDNGSSDDSEQVVREFGAKWLALGKNVGLAPALNIGAKSAAGQMLLFVNNDMRFDEGFVATLAKPLERDERIFATDGMQFNWDGSVRGHMATRLTQTKPLGRDSVELLPGLHFYQQEENAESRVFMGSAACLLVRRKLFEDLKGFDDHLPLGYEDAELCWRAWLRGWLTVFVPTAVCWHRIGASGRSEEGARLNFRGVLTGKLLFATKLLRYAVRTWAVAAAAIFKDLSRARWQLAKARILILTEMAMLVPQLLRTRRELFSSAGTSPQAHLEFLLKLTHGAD